MTLNYTKQCTNTVQTLTESNKEDWKLQNSNRDKPKVLRINKSGHRTKNKAKTT